MSKKSNLDKLPTRSVPENTIRLLEYLKKNTDKEHPLKTISDVRKAFADKSLNIGSDNTIRKYYTRIADAYNLDEEQHPRPQSQWRIVYDGYVRLYGDAEAEDTLFEKDDLDKTDADRERFRNLYYVSEFSYEEIDALIEAVQFSRTLTAKEAEKLILILEEKFASRHYAEYRKSTRKICKIHEKESYDRNLLRENLRTIQKAIDNKVRINYRFNGYTRDKKLAPMGDYERQSVSPYYIVAYNGRYYLIAANERYKDVAPYIIRIDLMTEVTIPERNEELGNKGIPRIPLKEVHNLPEQWDENFPMKHLNMSYDDSVTITIRIKNEKKEDGWTPKAPAYTFLHDYFGDTYKFLRVDEADPDYDIVTVRCPSFGMENFALQYADRVEVLEPEALREKIREKAQALAERYRDS